MCSTSVKPYTDPEKLLLTNLICEIGGCIENRKTDGTTLGEKQKAWERITEAYNCQPDVTVPRSAKQLRKLWDNLKQRKRKQETQNKFNRLLTGGGSEEKNDDPLLTLIDSVAPNADIEIDCPGTVLQHLKMIINERGQKVIQFVTEVPNNEHPQFVNSNITSNTPVEAPNNEPPQLVATDVMSHNSHTPVGRARTNRREQGYDEVYWRVLRIQESIEQQRELHKLRLQVAKDEADAAKYNKQAAKLAKEAAEIKYQNLLKNVK